MKRQRILLALLLACVLGLGLYACTAVPEPSEMQTRGSGNITSAGLIRWTPQTTATVSLNYALAPTSSLVPINATVENAGIDSIATKAAGTLLVLYVSPTTAASIKITDTVGAIALTGTLTLGAGDTLTLISDGIRWVQIATMDN